MVSLLILFLLAGNLCYSADEDVSIRGLVSVKYCDGVYHPNAEAKLSKGQNLIKGLKDVGFYYVDKGSVCELYNKFFEDEEYSVSCISVENHGASTTYNSEVRNVIFDPSSTYNIEVFRSSRCNVVLILEDDPKKSLTINDVEFKSNCFSTDSVSNNTRDLFTAIEEATENAGNSIGINLRDYRITEFSCSDGRPDCKDHEFFYYLDQMNKGDKSATLGLLFNDVFNPSNKLLLLKLKKLTKDESKVGGWQVKRIVNPVKRIVDEGKKSSDVDKKPSDRKSLNKCCVC